MNTIKIDPQILSLVQLFNSSKKIECLVYANNYKLTKLFLNKKKLNIIQEYPFVNAFGVFATIDNITNLSNLNCVTYITKNAKVNTLVNVSKKVLKIDENIKCDDNITVAVIDTGISNVIDFNIPKKRILNFVDFVNDKKVAYDDNGHGTFVSSIIGGNGLVSGNKYAGICNNCNIISLKALDENGEGSAFNILKAMQWVYDNRKKYNIKVVCMSFGALPADKNDPLMMGAEVLWNSGITVVSAAGNSGPDNNTIKSPGSSFKIITVGALDDDRENNFNEYKVAEFSSRGPSFGHYKPDVLAPGVNINSACSFQLNKKHYCIMSGTSVSAPIITGIVCLMLSKNKNLTPTAIKNLLIKCSEPINGNRNEEGYGVVNFSKILENI